MASLDLAHRRTTFNPVFSIFSVNWSTAVFEGAQTKIGPPCCFTNWYTMVADVTVFPVPGGPKIKIIHVHLTTIADPWYFWKGICHSKAHKPVTLSGNATFTKV